MSMHGCFLFSVDGRGRREISQWSYFNSYAGCFGALQSTPDIPGRDPNKVLASITMIATPRDNQQRFRRAQQAFLLSPFVQRLTKGKILAVQDQGGTYEGTGKTVHEHLGPYSNSSHLSMTNVVFDPNISGDRIVTAFRISQTAYKRMSVADVEAIPEELDKYIPFASAYYHGGGASYSDSDVTFYPITVQECLDHMLHHDITDMDDLYYEDFADGYHGYATLESAARIYNRTEEDFAAFDRVPYDNLLLKGYTKDDELSANDLEELQSTDRLSISAPVQDMAKQGETRARSVLELCQYLFQHDTHK